MGTVDRGYLVALLCEAKERVGKLTTAYDMMSWGILSLGSGSQRAV